MSTVLWSRTAAAVRERFGRTALAQYGAGLHTNCDDCAMEPADVAIPAPRTTGMASTSHGVAAEAAERR